MLLRLAALGTFGYAAYKFFTPGKPARRPMVAGGPLSDKATIQGDPNQPPPAELYED
jgi:hypothetical protein